MVNIEKYIDKYGYLLDFKLWNTDIAIAIANLENINLSKNHWQIIYTIRNFYLDYNIIPNMRILNKILEKKYGKKKGDTIYLFSLFPKGPIKQAVKIAGLPKTNLCL